jgi:hypothetical protein
VTVPAVSLDTAVNIVGGRVDILKVDIEGAEHAVLAAARRLDLVEVVLGEFHPAPGASWQSLRRSLNGMELRPDTAPDGELGLFVAVRGTTALSGA